MFEMKTSCLVCEATLAHDDSAAICSYECTYCRVRHGIKPPANCGGELVPRPKRKVVILVVVG